MPQHAQSAIKQMQLYLPLCSKCATPMQLARIESCDEPDHDLRTFECIACGYSAVMRVKYK